ncbi:protein spire homolog 1 isoform X1 [Alosa sapidissima]|uniref:protein spire homolog 1 isoform X1 n=1 Tax=Alosa sapidissima TaxID=34773 RepID=UPI001C08CD03|nr:protein spire homolog 1 isoform X1 [Alosa sapidissima]
MTTFQTMDGSVCVPNTCHICLKEILELQGHPITEEQAWALCYQLCTLLKDDLSERVVHNETPQPPRLPGVEAILFSNDGSVSFKDSSRPIFGREDQIVDQLGRLIYDCLDWGLDHDVERDLHEVLALLVCRMINVKPRTDASLLPIGLPEVIQVCEDRLDGTAQAAHHYKTVCSLLFSETIELYHYIQSYKTCIKSLQTFLESDVSLRIRTDSDQVHAWKYVVEEIQSREPLRPCSRTFPSNAYRPPEKLFPFDQLKQVIESKQYTLRKVQMGGNPLKKTDPCDSLLEAILAKPKLRPVSERKLRERTKEEPCLHERLMAEIRMTDPLELFASCKKRRAVQSLRMTSGLNLTGRKRRAQSVGSYPDTKRLRKGYDTGSIPVTIAMIMNAHQTEIDGHQKTIPETNPGKWQVCSCCSNRSQFFTWHNTCSRCDRVVCPSCCVKMRVPYKWCMDLPITFFRKIVLRQSAERDHSHFWRERLSWDCTKIPLVLEALALGSCSQHSLAMRGWHSQDICIECQGLLEETCDSGAFVNCITGTREI